MTTKKKVEEVVETPVEEDTPNMTDMEAAESIVERLQGDVMLLTDALTATRRLIFVMSKHVGADNALIQAGVKPDELHKLTARELKGKR